MLEVVRSWVCSCELYYMTFCGSHCLGPTTSLTVASCLTFRRRGIAQLPATLAEIQRERQNQHVLKHAMGIIEAISVYLLKLQRPEPLQICKWWCLLAVVIFCKTSENVVFFYMKQHPVGRAKMEGFTTFHLPYFTTSLNSQTVFSKVCKYVRKHCQILTWKFDCLFRCASLLVGLFNK